MPILHVQYGGTGRDPKGKTVQLPPRVALLQQGPCIQVTIGVAKRVASQLLASGATLPQPVSGSALIDTGASRPCIDDDTAQQLGLPVVDVVRISSASHSATQQNCYPIQIDVVGPDISIDVPKTIGAQLAAQGIIALIGRDFLQHCVLHYNGISGAITLSI